MAGPTEQLRTRVLPAVLTAFGVTILSAGLLTYTVPVPPGPSGAPIPSPDPSVAVIPTPTPLISLPPIGSAGPTATPNASPTPPADRVATRVRIKGLGIDLAVVKGPSGYPYCNVAMYLPALGQPGFGRATYLYAHAREGMFLPLLRTKGVNQRGLIVEVWTSDDWLFRYEITQVLRDQPVDTGLDAPSAVTTEELWLQTSQGPNRTFGYTQVVATPVSSQPSDHAGAHPTARPVTCG